MMGDILQAGMCQIQTTR